MKELKDILITLGIGAVLFVGFALLFRPVAEDSPGFDGNGFITTNANGSVQTNVGPVPWLK